MKQCEYEFGAQDVLSEKDQASIEGAKKISRSARLLSRRGDFPCRTAPDRGQTIISFLGEFQVPPIGARRHSNLDRKAVVG